MFISQNVAVRYLLLSLVGFVFLFSSCKPCCPVTKQFYTNPRVVCPGDEVDVHWYVKQYLSGIETAGGECRLSDPCFTAITNNATGAPALTPVHELLESGLAFRDKAGENKISGLTADVELSFNLTCGSDCQSSLPFMGTSINVADGVNDYYDLTFERADHELKWTFDCGTPDGDLSEDDFFAENIVVNLIDNLHTSAAIRVTLDSSPLEEKTIPPGASSDGFGGDPNGIWTVVPASEADAVQLRENGEIVLRMHFVCSMR